MQNVWGFDYDEQKDHPVIFGVAGSAETLVTTDTVT
jgi:hypothetical protein